ncbi:unnamed protein product [Effrenium voratum]|uniref:Uncharacterized protein n=1 Tax=Effrenium voratum TaxID=2562239 RepID=A0AA36IRZ8_9DINO|nr:unnamed protein product [Effrenium voratum]CAJ1442693.1 unnamed protein product [Effrenium voratum]
MDQTKFEGQSTTHQDYRVPPVEELQELIAATSSSRSASGERKPACRFEGESSMRAHYRAPSHDAVRGAATASGQRERSLPTDRVPSSKFEGESNALRDFQAPLPELRYPPSGGTSYGSTLKALMKVVIFKLFQSASMLSLDLSPGHVQQSLRLTGPWMRIV